MIQKFPREYRMRVGCRYFSISLAGFFLLVGVLGTLLALADGQGDGPTRVVLAICIVFFLFGTWVMLSTLRTHVVLRDDSIEVQGLFGTQRLALVEIGGRRLVRASNSPTVIKLVSAQRHVPSIQLPYWLETDEGFDEWMGRVPDLDAEERRQSESAYFGSNDGTRRELTERLDDARRIARVVNYGTGAAAIWAVIYPHPIEAVVAVIAVLPWIALTMGAKGRGAYSLVGCNNDIRVDLAPPLLVPGLLLTFLAFKDFYVIDWTRLLWPAIAVALVGAAALILASMELRQYKASCFLLPVLVFFYAFGAVSFTNKLFDRAQPEIIATQVVNARLGSGRSKARILELAPWGPRATAEEVNVSRALYESVAAGDTVCVYLWPGALGARWFDVGNCAE